jgi:hypothetical protein
MDNKTRIEKEASLLLTDGDMYYVRQRVMELIEGQERSYNKGWNDAIEAIVEKLGDDLNKNEHVEGYWPKLKEELESLKTLDENK